MLPTFVLYNPLDLEEATKPPDLEEGLANDKADDKEIPPLDACVGALGGVAVGALTDDDVLLLVLDLGEEVGEGADWGDNVSAITWLWGYREVSPGGEDIPSFSRGSTGVSASLT